MGARRSENCFGGGGGGEVAWALLEGGEGVGWKNGLKIAFGVEDGAEAHCLNPLASLVAVPG